MWIIVSINIFRESTPMKFLKAGNNMLTEAFGAVEDTAKMIRGATKAGVVHTSAWEDTAKMQVQQAKLENASKFMKKMDKLMDKIDSNMLQQSKEGYLELDMSKVLEAYQSK